MKLFAARLSCSLIRRCKRRLCLPPGGLDGLLTCTFNLTTPGPPTIATSYLGLTFSSTPSCSLGFSRSILIRSSIQIRSTSQSNQSLSRRCSTSLDYIFHRYRQENTISKMVAHRKLRKQVLLCFESSFPESLSSAMTPPCMRETSKTETGLARTLKSCSKMGS